MNIPPACTCDRPDGAHDERCAYIRWVRSTAYDPGDMEIPLFLLRKIEEARGGVFD